jgi:hypothetical protein
VRRVDARLGLVAVAATVIGCGLPVLIDLDGRPVAYPRALARGPSAWLALDTTGGRWRAILEWDLVAQAGGEPPIPTGLTLVTGSVRHRPRRVRIGEVCCDPVPPRREQQLGPRYGRRGQVCRRLLVAEFPIDRRSDLSEPRLVADWMAVALAWMDGEEWPALAARQ